MECPDCHITLHDSATYCGCGWKKQKPQIDISRFSCGWEPCVKTAICRLHTKTGWLWVCEQHYNLYFKRRADETCTELKLYTTTQKREWLREKCEELAQKWKPKHETMREPGQDVEEQPPF